MSRIGGFVYIVKEEESGLFKIGAAQNPAYRLSALNAGNPRKLYLIHTIPADYRHYGETYLHKMFKEYRRSGEWFELPNEALEVICKIQRYKWSGGEQIFFKEEAA